LLLIPVIISYREILKIPTSSGNSCLIVSMKVNKFNSQSGVSLIEILVVLIIAALLATFSIGQFAKSRRDYQRQNLSRELKINLERARFDSVKRRAVDPGTTGATDTRAMVKINSATSFSVSTDLNMDGTLSSTEVRQIDFTGRVDASIIGSSTDFPLTIKFDQRGQTTIVNNSGTTIDPSFTVCGSGCTASTANSANADVIYISPTGTIAMSPGGTAQPTFANPTVSTVSGAANIDNRVSVNTSNYPY
jgi:prepilin-type N-terminal cleavage/methylation domain-containing protein